MSRNIVKDLIRRRVPHILGAYFAGGWVVLEFVNFVTNRYLLSPHLTDFAMLTWALMFPSVAILAYLHGAPGPDSWTKVEKIGIPLNAVLAAAVLVFVFAGKELGATTRTVTVATEEGDTIERVVPKAAFRKSLAEYFFDNISADTSLDWLQYGVPAALRYDLEQDLFLDVRGGDAQLDRLREDGFADGLRVSLALKRELADELHLTYFLSGEIDERDGDIVVRTQLYETQRGRLLEEREYSGSDFFELVDEMSVQLKRDLKIPSQHIEETRDLPVSEILTTSVDAARSLIEGNRAAIIDNDYAAAASDFEDAIRVDPQFALAYFLLFSAELNLGHVAAAQRAMEQAMGLLYKLPERTQLTAKAAYYWLVKQDLRKAITAAAMHAELYPQDIEAHEALAQLYGMQQDKGRAIEALESILDLDPGRIDVLLQIGRLHESQGELQAARQYYERYAHQAPSDPTAFIALGDLERQAGDHEAAREQYERAAVLDPGNVAGVLRLADLDADQGRFEQAAAGYDEALSEAVTAERRAEVYEALRNYYELRGQPSRGIEATEQLWVEQEKSMSPFNALQAKLQSLQAFLSAGRISEARDTIASIAARLTPPFDALLPFGQASLYLELEDPDSLEAAAAEIERFVELFGIEDVHAYSIYLHGRALELRGDCSEALISYERASELRPSSVSRYLDMGRCQRKLGRLDEAAVSLDRVLKVRPSDPRARYELALVYADGGDVDQAIEQLRRALKTWENAEPEYKPAREARDKLAELSGGS